MEDVRKRDIVEIGAPMDELSYCSEGRDRRSLLRSLDDLALAARVGSDSTCLSVKYQVLDETAWERLGQILGRSKHLETLILHRNIMHTEDFWLGLRDNRSIRSLDVVAQIGLGCRGLSCMRPFLTHSPCIKSIVLRNCNIDAKAVDLLSDALLERSDDTLEHINLCDNRFGDVNLDKLVEVVRRNSNMKSLWLENNGIGRRGCASLAKLLGKSQSTLESFRLGYNAIDDVAAARLASSLADNTTLVSLDLDMNHDIKTAGWSALLKLVCNSSSVTDVAKSNHTLCNFGRFFSNSKRALETKLEDDDASLLRASLKMNGTFQKREDAVRHKILWSHIRGDLNVGVSSIDTGALPSILAWIGDSSDEAEKLQDHQPQYFNLDAFYRIAVSRPELCNGGARRPAEEVQEQLE